MNIVLYIFCVIIIILMVIGFIYIGYDLGVKDTVEFYKKKECNKCNNHKTRNCPNSNKCYNTLNKPYFKI